MDIIFDGYLDNNAKDHCQSNEVDFLSNMLLDCRKDFFLSNSSNKQLFPNLLTISLLSAGHNVKQHTDHADRILGDKVLEFENRDNVIVPADDTGIMVLLINRLPTSPDHYVYLKLDKSNRTVNMTQLIGTISSSKIDNILYVHAMSGCDATDMFGISKSNLFKSSILKEEGEHSLLLVNVEGSIKDILDAGKKKLLILYGKHGFETLDDLRSRLYKTKLHSYRAKKNPCFYVFGDAFRVLHFYCTHFQAIFSFNKIFINKFF